MHSHFKVKLKIFSLLFPVVFFLTLLLLPACAKKIDYFSYVSELRQNIFLAENEDFSLRVYSVAKESPYIADGIPREISHRTEVYLIAPSGEKDCRLSFLFNEETYGGEMSYDNVKSEYYFSCTLDISKLTALDCTISYGETEITLNAKSVLNGDELSPKSILQYVQKENMDLFTNLTDKYGFSGEIYIRLIYEENAYYYIGIIDRTGKIYAFLTNAKNGKILAKRES